MGHQERRDFSSRAESILEAMAIARATGEKSVLSVSCVRSVVKIRLRSVAQTAGLTPEDTQLIRWVAWADASAAPRTTKAVRLSRPGRGRPRSGRERVVSDWRSAGACLPHPPPSASTSPGTGEVNLPERPTARSRFFHSKPRADTNVTKRQPGGRGEDLIPPAWCRQRSSSLARAMPATTLLPSPACGKGARGEGSASRHGAVWMSNAARRDRRQPGTRTGDVMSPLEHPCQKVPKSAVRRTR